MVKCYVGTWNEDTAFYILYPQFLRHYEIPKTYSGTNVACLNSIRYMLNEIEVARGDGKTTAEMWGRVKRLKKEAREIRERQKERGELKDIVKRKVEEDKAMNTLKRDEARDVAPEST